LGKLPSVGFKRYGIQMVSRMIELYDLGVPPVHAVHVSRRIRGDIGKMGELCCASACAAKRAYELPVRIKSLNPLVSAVCNIDGSVDAHGDRCRESELALAYTVLPPLINIPAVKLKDLDAAQVPVYHVYQVLICRNADRLVKLACSRAASAPLIQKRPLGVKLLNALVSQIADVDVPPVILRYCLWV